MIAANEKNIQLRGESRMVHSHPSGDGGGFPSSYPSISPSVLKPVLLDPAAPAFLFSPTEIVSTFEEGKGEEKRRGGSDESGRGGGGREKEREIEFLGCILKPVELSGTSGGKVGGRNGRAWTEFRIFPFVYPFLSQPVSFSTFDLFV